MMDEVRTLTWGTLSRQILGNTNTTVSLYHILAGITMNAGAALASGGYLSRVIDIDIKVGNWA